MSTNKNDIEKSKEYWEALAYDWDTKMGDNDNCYHREIIRPSTLKLLEPKEGEHILDCACGNGNFSRFMAKLGVKVTAFDYSVNLIELAKKRAKNYLNLIDFHVGDATNYDDLMKLQQGEKFDKAVSNMAIMDIAEIEPLFKAIYDMLKNGGIFVFFSVHPCFQTPHMKKVTYINDYTQDDVDNGVKMGIETFEYIKPQKHEVTVLANNDKRIIHFHRPLNELLKICFNAGFVLDGIEEPVFEKPEQVIEFDFYEIPPSIILRLRKI